MIANHQFRLKCSAFIELKKVTWNPKVVPLIKVIEKLVKKKYYLGISVLPDSKPVLRRRWEDPDLIQTYKDRAILSGCYIIENLYRNTHSIDYQISLWNINRAFHSIKEYSLSTSSIPGNIRKKQSRQWSIPLMSNMLQLQINKLTNFALNKLRRNCSSTVNKKYPEKIRFNIDKEVIRNQAKVLVYLETQLYNKSKEANKLKRQETFMKIYRIFLYNLQRAFSIFRPASSPDQLSVHENQREIDEIFDYLYYLEEMAGQSGFLQEENRDFEDVKARIERRSYDNSADVARSERCQDEEEWM
jgi:hypothetical protein